MNVDANRGKAAFDRIYQGLDPREYFRVLYGLDYVIPELARGIFRSLIDALPDRCRKPPRILDIGCSYGINAALIRYPLDMQQLARRYSSPEMYSLTASEMALLDGLYFRSWPRLTQAEIVGLDASPHAIAYAVNTGLLDAGMAANLEKAEPEKHHLQVLRGLDLIISTGCVGYVTEPTFRRILACQDGRLPWIANFVLRLFPYDSLSTEFERHGLVTEKLEGVTFVQRRFHSEAEAATALDLLRERGIDPRGKEADGLLHAELFVSRPPEAVHAAPLNRIVSLTSGAYRPYGCRFRQLDDGSRRLMH